MTVDTAIDMTRFLQSYHYSKIMEITDFPYVDGWKVPELMYEKLLSILNTRIGLTADNGPTFSTQHSWKNTGNSNMCRNIFEFSNTHWTYSIVTGAGNVYTIDDYLIQNCPNVDIYSVGYLLLAIYPFVGRNFIDFENESIEQLFPINEFYTLCSYFLEVQGIDDSSYLENVDDATFVMGLRKSMYLLLKYILFTAEHGFYPEDTDYGQSLFPGCEISISDYADNLTYILHDVFVPDISCRMFLAVLPYFLSFLTSDECGGSDPTSYTFWVFENFDIPKYLGWRKTSACANDSLLNALDKALSIILFPFGMSTDYFCSDYIQSEQSVAIWAITSDRSFDRINPYFRLAREIWDSLYPVWEERYCNFENEGNFV